MFQLMHFTFLVVLFFQVKLIFDGQHRFTLEISIGHTNKYVPLENSKTEEYKFANVNKNTLSFRMPVTWQYIANT